MNVFTNTGSCNHMTIKEMLLMCRLYRRELDKNFNKFIVHCVRLAWAFTLTELVPTHTKMIDK